MVAARLGRVSRTRACRAWSRCLVVTPERQYTVASSAEAAPMHSYEMFAEQAADAPLSAYHAAFGAAPAPQPLEQPQPGGQGTQRQVDQRVQELLDVPPPTCCPAWTSCWAALCWPWRGRPGPHEGLGTLRGSRRASAVDISAGCLPNALQLLTAARQKAST